MKSFRYLLLPLAIGFVAGLVLAQGIVLTQSGERIAYTGLAVVLIVIGTGFAAVRQRLGAGMMFQSLDYGFFGIGGALLGIVAMSLL